MTLEALMKEAESLSNSDRRKLIAFLVVLDDRKREGYAEMLTRKMDDKRPERWLSLEQCAKKLGIDVVP